MIKLIVTPSVELSYEEDDIGATVSSGGNVAAAAAAATITLSPHFLIRHGCCATTITS